MNENNHNELIDHIREVLHEHREFYPPDAWKEFQQHRRKRSNVFAGKIAMGIAASLLLLLALNSILSQSGETISPKMTVEQFTGKAQKPDKRQRAMSVPPAPASKNKAAAIVQKENRRDAPPKKTDNTNRNSTLQNFAARDASAIGIKKVEQPKLVSSFPEIISLKAKDISATTEASPPARSWPVVTEAGLPAGPEQDDPFSFGVAYTSLVNANGAKTDWGMGGGIFTNWNFARDFALSSGVFIAQNQLKYNESGTMEAATSENLAYVQVDLVSLEVPLSLRYFVSDHISVSAGISSAAFLRENYNYTYEHQLEVMMMDFREGAGQPVTKEITVTETQKQSEPSFNSVNWAAFYTFSLAYRFDISDRNTLSLEPFVKLPSGQLTSRQITYTTGGLQLKISF